MTKEVHTNLDFLGAARIIGLPDATDPQHPATLAQLRSAIEGLSWKDDVVVATQSNINLAAPGATIDGVAMVSGDRFLVRAQSTPSQNGIYIFNGAASPATRSADANTALELRQATVTAHGGTSAGSTFRQSATVAVIDTDVVTFVGFGTSAPAASETTPGIAEIATQAETDAGTNDVAFITPLKLATHSGRKLKSAANFGDAAATQFNVTHNHNTRDVLAKVYRNGGDYAEIICDIEVTTVNALTLRFAVAPSNDQFRVVVIG